MSENLLRDQNRVTVAGGQSSTDSTVVLPFKIDSITGRVLTDAVGGTGTVTSVSIVSANGLAGTVATATTTPAITLSTTINSPVLAGNGTAIAAATTTGSGSTVALSTSPIFTTDITVNGTVNAGSVGTQGQVRFYSNAATGTGAYGYLQADNSVLGRLNFVAGQGSAAAVNQFAFGAGILPIADATYDLGIVTSAWRSIITGTVELGGTTDTTLSRISAGVAAIEGVTIDTISAANTLTNKTLAGAAITGALTGTGAYVPVSLLNSGTSASSSTFWRGDGTWATPSGSGTVNSGTSGNLAYYASTAAAVSGNTSLTYANAGGTPILNIGVAAGEQGTVKIHNSSGGTTGVTPAASASTFTLTLPAATDTLVGLATSDTLTNKTLTSPTLTTPVLGTPSSGTLTNCTGLPVAGITASTSTALGVGSIELGAASDTTVARVSAGVISVEGVTIPSISSTNTLTNKRVTRRLTTTNNPGATPTTNTDNVDIMNFTGCANAITSMTTNLSGTPVDGDLVEFRFTDNGTARAITFGTSFAATTVALPTTTVISTMLRVLFEWNSTTSKWECLATA